MSNEMILSKPLRRARAAAPTTPPAGPESTVRTGSRAAELQGGNAAARLHDEDARRAPASSAIEVLEVTLHDGLQIRVHYDRAGALIFAELGKDLVRDGQRCSQAFPGHGRRTLRFAGWRTRTAARWRSASGCFCWSAVGQRLPILWRRRLQDLRRRWRCVRCTPKRKSARDKRLYAIKKEIVKLGPGLAADLDGVFETRSRDQSDARAFALQQSICANCGAMQKHRGARACRSFPGPRQSPAKGRPAWRKP